MRRILLSLYEFFFPSKFTQEVFMKIPHAPRPPQDWVYSMYDYHSPTGKRLVYDIKQKKDWVRDYYIAGQIVERFKEHLSEKQQFGNFLHPYIVTVPLSKKSSKERGFDQMEYIARHLARAISGKYIKKVAYMKDCTKKQALLNKKDRRKNMHKSITLNKQHYKSLKHQDVIILDDIITSGATMEEMRRVLVKSNVREIIGISIAH